MTVTLPDGRPYTLGSLLTNGDRNVKLLKSNKAGKGYRTFGLSLAPSKVSGFNVCQYASPLCAEACLYTSGHGSMHCVQDARIAKTIAFFLHREWFLSTLRDELTVANRRARGAGLILAVRPNMLSDLPWETIDPSLFSDFRDVQFYDYTKRPNRVTPSNYHLTFSRSEVNESQALVEYRNGRNVAVVFESADLPARWNGIKVFSGDKTDLRFLDPRGIVGLYAKGKARTNPTAFVVPVTRSNRRIA